MVMKSFGGILALVFLLTGFSSPDTTAIAQQQGVAENVSFVWGFGALVGKEKKFVPITRDTALKTGDEIKMVVELKKECYVYLIHHSSKGEVSLLFPEDVRQFSGDYETGKNYYVPKGKGWFELDKNTGRESFYLLGSAERLLELEVLIGNYQSASSDEKQKIADQILTEIRSVKRKFRTFTTLAERPVTIGGNIRGVEDAGKAKRPDVTTIATEIKATNFYSKTFTIDHQ